MSLDADANPAWAPTTSGIGKYADYRHGDPEGGRAPPDSAGRLSAYGRILDPFWSGSVVCVSVAKS